MKKEDADFSLVLGGPLYQLFLRSRLAQPPLQLLHRRLLFITGIVWVPPFLLSLQEGTLLGGVEVPFVHDIMSHARFLIALPLFLMAERVVHERLKLILDQFIIREIIA